MSLLPFHWFSLLLGWHFLGATTNGQGIELFSSNPDIPRNTTQILQARGFDSQIHHPITQDGYILTLVRIVNPYTRSAQSNLRPFYFQHGLFGNADDFLLSPTGRLVKGKYVQLSDLALTDCSGHNATGMTLALVLATCGYDVWLGNSRGNRYSTGHILLDPMVDSLYWSFSVDELSHYDVPANIEYILSTTGFSQLGYVGHSLGTSSMFQLLSDRPDYSRYIQPYIALAPVAYVKHIEAALLQVAAHIPSFIDYLGRSNMPFFGVTSDVLSVIDQFIATFVCGNTFLKPFCSLFLFSLCGFDFQNLSPSLVPPLYGHFPDGTSSRVLAHLAQRVTRNTFSYYDFGEEKNQKIYNTPTAPVYNLSRINLKSMILLSGINDFLADPTDVDMIRSQLTVRPYVDYVVPFQQYNHVDFLVGSNAGSIQNNRILQWLQQLYEQ